MTSVKSLQKQLLAAVAMVLVAAIAMSSATYAWFVNNAAVTATDVTVTAATAYSLQIKGSDANDAYGTTKALNDSVTFTPVSTVGALVTTGAATTAGSTASTVANEIQFYTSDAWNADGVVSTFLTVGKATVADLNGDGNFDTSKGDSYYYYTDTVYLKAGQECNIYLDSRNTGIAYTDSSNNAKVLAFSADAAAYKAALDDTSTDADESAAMYNLVKTLRVALVVTQTPSSGSATRKVYFYELNNGLIDTATTNATSYKTTISDADGLKLGVSATNAVSSYSSTNIANLSSNAIKTISSAMIEGSDSSKVSASTSTADVLASVAANEEVQVDIYIWMEGCDYDTTAANSAKFETTIEGLQFGFCVGEAASS
jgi:hypothetical protein